MEAVFYARRANIMKDTASLIVQCAVLGKLLLTKVLIPVSCAQSKFKLAMRDQEHARD